MPIAVNRNGTIFLEFSPVPERELDSDTCRPLPGSVIAVRHSQDFLLVYHHTRQRWELPGGHIEEGESPRDCAVRELLEETGQSVECLAFEAVLKLRAGPDNRIEFGALYSGSLAVPAPFRESEEISRIMFWDGKTDIGYVDEIDAAVINLLQTGSV
jgi:8-oxo-dGTP diphosphatase